jgi:hypothetical protein
MCDVDMNRASLSRSSSKTEKKWGRHQNQPTNGNTLRQIAYISGRLNARQTRPDKDT